MNTSMIPSGTDVSRPDNPLNEALDLGRILGQRRAFAAIGGHCSAAHAQLLRRIRDQKLYLPVAPSWRAFCAGYLTVSRRHADRLISLLNRFGPVYFELAELIGLSPRQYQAIEPAVREDRLLVDGEAISLVPENASRILQAVDRILGKSSRPHRPPRNLAARVADLAGRGRTIATQLVELYHSAQSAHDRELILEAATGIRIILMQPGI